MNINLIINPTQKLIFKLDEEQKIEIVIKGTTPIVEQYIEELLYVKHQNEEQALKAGREYVRRLISCCVKEVNGLSINDKPFKITFKQQDIEEIDEDSYNILMRVFDNFIKKDFVQPILAFYTQNKNNKLEQNTEIVFEDKKKD